VTRDRRAPPGASPRPRRGTPEETRRRLVQAAAEVFNRDGYDGTDSNRIARAAGYAPGTFYNHFADKRQVFLAVYADWVAQEWRDISTTIAAAGSAAQRSERIVDVFLGHHQRWRGFRASLRALVSADAEVRDFYRAQRRLQLELLAELRRGARVRAGSREADVLLLFTIERAADALADGELDALNARREVIRDLLLELVKARLAPLP